MDNPIDYELVGKLVAEDMARKNVLKAIEKYGIEGTEQAINNAYVNCPKIKELMLETYRLILWS